MANRFDDDGEPRFAAGYTGHVPGKKWGYGSWRDQQRREKEERDRMRAGGSGREEVVHYTKTRSVDRPPSGYGRRGGNSLDREVSTRRYVSYDDDRRERSPSRDNRAEEAERAYIEAQEGLYRQSSQYRPETKEAYNQTEEPRATEPRMAYRNDENSDRNYYNKYNDRHLDRNQRNGYSYSREEYSQNRGGGREERRPDYRREGSSEGSKIFQNGTPAAGYTGHVPRYKGTVGKTFSNTVKDLVDEQDEKGKRAYQDRYMREYFDQDSPRHSNGGRFQNQVSNQETRSRNQTRPFSGQVRQRFHSAGGYQTRNRYYN